MAKYTQEFKLKIINEYLQGDISYSNLATKYAVDQGMIHRWIEVFEAMGSEGLRRSKSKRVYDTEFKIKVVEEYLLGNISYQDLALKYHIPNFSLITRWKLDYEKEGIRGLQPKKRGRPSKEKTDNKTSDDDSD